MDRQTEFSSLDRICIPYLQSLSDAPPVIHRLNSQSLSLCLNYSLVPVFHRSRGSLFQTVGPHTHWNCASQTYLLTYLLTEWTKQMGRQCYRGRRTNSNSVPECTHQCTGVYTSVYRSVHINVPECTHQCTGGYTSVYRSVHISVPVCTHQCTGVYTSVCQSVHISVPEGTHQCTGVYTSVYRKVHISVQEGTHQCTGGYTSVYRSVHISVQECTHQCTGKYTSVYRSAHISVHITIDHTRQSSIITLKYLTDVWLEAGTYEPFTANLHCHLSFHWPTTHLTTVNHSGCSHSIPQVIGFVETTVDSPDSTLLYTLLTSSLSMSVLKMDHNR